VGVADGTAGEAVAAAEEDADTPAVGVTVLVSVLAGVADAAGVPVAVAVAENGGAEGVPLALTPALSDAVAAAVAEDDALTARVSVTVLVAVTAPVGVGDGDSCPQQMTSPEELSAHDQLSPALTPTTAPDEAAAAGMGDTCPFTLLPKQATLPAASTQVWYHPAATPVAPPPDHCAVGAELWLYALSPQHRKAPAAATPQACRPPHDSEVASSDAGGGGDEPGWLAPAAPQQEMPAAAAAGAAAAQA